MRRAVHQIIAAKGRQQLTELNVASVEHAVAAQEAGIDIIVSGNAALRREFRGAAPDVHFTFGLRYGQQINADIARRQAFEALEDGADSIYCAAHFDIVEAMAREGIPVVGHVGLIPQKARWTGYRAIGKTVREARDIAHAMQRYVDAGAFAVEMEVVPQQLAGHLARNSPLVVISMGSGAGCDVQYLFAIDVLGETRGPVPRHARQYRDFRSEYDRLHRERVAAFAAFRDDVAQGRFPGPAEVVEMPAGHLDDFLRQTNQETD